jgi:small subunit ribosomal protein S30e
MNDQTNSQKLLGKVKAATPKVEKQEKPKTPKGRARKRILYTRRFVNVTLTGGKRKVCMSHIHISLSGLLLGRRGRRDGIDRLIDGWMDGRHANGVDSV